MSGWTTPADVRAAVQREWDRGRLPAALLEPSGDGAAATAFPFRIPLRRPTAREVMDRFAEVRDWATSLQTMPRIRIESASVPNRTLGPQVLPASAWVDSAPDALALIGRTGAGQDVIRLHRMTPAPFQPVITARPHQVLEVADDWPALVTAAEWIVAHPNPEVYLRQVDLSGVHSKTIERHRRLIASLVESARPTDSPITTGHGWFERRYGFRTKPSLIRFRQLDPARCLLPGLTDITVPVAEFAALPAAVSRVFVTENEINFLAFPATSDAIVVFGSGNEAPETLGAVGWLADTAVHYWGDIDTHGFAILDRLRSRLPNTRSLLMDTGTLLAHRDSWGREETQVHRDLASLSDSEAELYGGLIAGKFGDHIRLEQEFVRFGIAAQAVAATD